MTMAYNSTAIPDYNWVPENCIYNNVTDCMKAHPQEPAILLAPDEWRLKYYRLAQALKTMIDEPKHRMSNILVDRAILELMRDNVNTLPE